MIFTETKYTIFIILSCLIILDAVKFRSDYTYYNVGWFSYHAVPMTWSDARLFCRVQGAILASPTSRTIKNIMMDVMTETDIFTGIHSIYTKGQYFTVDGIPLSKISIKWADSEPDNKNDAERCLSLNHEGKMSDVNCNAPRPFVCFRKNSDKGANACGTIDPEYQYDARTNKCYKFHTNAREFYRANFVCAAEGGHLAIINSEEESTVIKDIFAKYPASQIVGNLINKDVAIIGFHNWGESMDWTTVEGQSLQEAGFDKFAPGEPNNYSTGEYCGSVTRGGLLNDLLCETHFAFICEKKPNFPSVCDSENEEEMESE